MNKSVAWNQIITEKCQILVRRTSSGNGWVIPSNHDHTTIITNRHNNKTRQSTFPFILEKVPIFRKIKSLSVVIKSYNGWFVIKWNHNLVIFLAEFYIGLLKTSCITLFRLPLEFLSNNISRTHFDILAICCFISGLARSKKSGQQVSRKRSYSNEKGLDDMGWV